MRSAAVLDRLKDPRIATFISLLAIPTIMGDLLPSSEGILVTGAVTILLVLILLVREAPGMHDLFLAFRQGKVLLFFLPAAGVFGLSGYGVPVADQWLRGLGLVPLASATVAVTLLAVLVWGGIRLGMHYLIGKDLDREMLGVIVGLLLASTIIAPGLSTTVLAGQIASLLQSLGLSLLLVEALTA